MSHYVFTHSRVFILIKNIISRVVMGFNISPRYHDESIRDSPYVPWNISSFEIWKPFFVQKINYSLWINTNFHMQTPSKIFLKIYGSGRVSLYFGPPNDILTISKTHLSKKTEGVIWETQKLSCLTWTEMKIWAVRSLWVVPPKQFSTLFCPALRLFSSS